MYKKVRLFLNMCKNGKRTFLYTFLMQVTMCKKVYLFVRFWKGAVESIIMQELELKVDSFKKRGYTNNVRKVRNTLLWEGGFTMELAKVTSKGQVTIPVEIRKKLGIKNGDKVLFMEEAGRVYMMNSSMDALREAQRAFAGEAERLGLENDDDVMAMIKELRNESVVK